MNRRQFTQAIAASAFAAASPALPAVAAAPTDASAATAFPLSVMLWTVFNDLPFEERLAKVVEAGYTNIELVGEYAKWGPADFDRANAARKRLGIRFDATAGLKNGVANPAQRDALMAELGQALIPMQSLGCPAMIMLSGNVVPGQSWWRESRSTASRCGFCSSAFTSKKIRTITSPLPQRRLRLCGR
jgi:hydroxypyruvate isomerase